MAKPHPVSENTAADISVSAGSARLSVLKSAALIFPCRWTPTASKRSVWRMPNMACWCFPINK